MNTNITREELQRLHDEYCIARENLNRATMACDYEAMHGLTINMDRAYADYMDAQHQYDEQIRAERKRREMNAKRESAKWVIGEMFKVIPADKLNTFNGAINRNAILTSSYFLAHGTLTVYKEGWYVEFEGCRSRFGYWCADNDGVFVPGRKPSADKLRKLWSWHWYNEENWCEDALNAANAAQTDEDSKEVARFKVGDKNGYAGLYGGWYDIEVVSRTRDTVTLRSRWIAEDIGKPCHSDEVYNVEIEDVCGTLVERVAVWEYLGAKGYVYALNDEELSALYDDGSEFPEFEDYEEKDYGPSNPWDAPGMKISDFITGVSPF